RGLPRDRLPGQPDLRRQRDRAARPVRGPRMTAYRKSLQARLRAARLSQSRGRGSVSMWVVMFAFVKLALLILVVDGGQVIIAKSRAADIAEQAARAAADDINPAALRNGQVAIAQGACDTPGPASDLVSTYSKG